MLILMKGKNRIYLPASELDFYNEHDRQGIVQWRPETELVMGYLQVRTLHLQMKNQSQLPLPEDLTAVPVM